MKNSNEYIKQRKKIDPLFKLRRLISTKIYQYINKIGLSKNNSCIEYISYSIYELKLWIEKQFEPWMTWDNHGVYRPTTWDDNDSSTWTWQIDHIMPQSMFDFSKPEEIEKCWALENLRPLSSKENIHRNRKYVKH